jgi:DNA replication protein DnaC
MPLSTPHPPKTENDILRARAEALHLHGLLTHWSEVATQPWLAPMLDWEEHQRARRSLERRLSTAHIGRFKPLCDFDWTWPKHCDRAAVDARITLDFLKEAANVVCVGPNGVGKSMFAQNIAHQAVIDGHTVLFTSAGQLLGDLCALEIPVTWTPEQALAVWEMLDELREKIWTRYSCELRDLLAEEAAMRSRRQR